MVELDTSENQYLTGNGKFSTWLGIVSEVHYVHLSTRPPRKLNVTEKIGTFVYRKFDKEKMISRRIRPGGASTKKKGCLSLNSTGRKIKNERREKKSFQTIFPTNASEA